MGVSIPSLLRSVGTKAALKSVEIESVAVATKSPSIDPSKISLVIPMEGMNDVRMIYYNGRDLGEASLQQGGMILEIDIKIPADLQKRGLFKEVFKQLEKEMNPIGFDATWTFNAGRYAENEGFSTNLKKYFWTIYLKWDKKAPRGLLLLVK